MTDLMRATRDGFGEGLVLAAEKDTRIIALTADLGESTRLEAFKKRFPKRFIQTGVAEQNLVTIASGLSQAGFIPFATSFAAFSPGRNWEQIRTTICYNDQNVKIVGSHTGLGVGEDGATHQALEDVALMRVLPNITVVVPCDAIQAKKATMALAKLYGPAYLRLNRQKSQVITSEKDSFQIGKAQILRAGKDIAIIACGPLVADALRAADLLSQQKISCSVINMHTVKPLDETAILAAARKTRAILTLEDHQIAGGLGGAVAEVLSEKYPCLVERMGVENAFGQSGDAALLYQAYHLTAQDIVGKVKMLLVKKRKMR